MDAKIEIFDVTDSECLLIAAALHAGSQKTIEELILEFQAAKNSPAGLAVSACVAADRADRDLQFANLQDRATAVAGKVSDTQPDAQDQPTLQETKDPNGWMHAGDYLGGGY